MEQLIAVRAHLVLMIHVWVVMRDAIWIQVLKVHVSVIGHPQPLVAKRTLMTPGLYVFSWRKYIMEIKAPLSHGYVVSVS